MVLQKAVRARAQYPRRAVQPAVEYGVSDGIVKYRLGLFIGVRIIEGVKHPPCCLNLGFKRGSLILRKTGMISKPLGGFNG